MPVLRFTLGLATGFGCSYLVLDAITERRLLTYPKIAKAPAGQQQWNDELGRLMRAEHLQRPDDFSERLRAYNNQAVQQLRTGVTAAATACQAAYAFAAAEIKKATETKK